MAESEAISDELRRAALDYMAKHQIDLFKPRLWELPVTLRPGNGHYVNGYPCAPCPNCGDEIMWYRESTWRYDAAGRIENGMSCERCSHHWNDVTGEVWLQGLSRAEVREQWKGIYEPPDVESLSADTGRVL